MSPRPTAVRLKELAREILTENGVADPPISKVAQLLRLVKRIQRIEREDKATIARMTGSDRPHTEAESRQTGGGTRVIRKSEPFS